jgi:hypothetical protein
MEVKISIPPEASLLVQAAHSCKVYETRTPVYASEAKESTHVSKNIVEYRICFVYSFVMNITICSYSSCNQTSVILLLTKLHRESW